MVHAKQNQIRARLALQRLPLVTAVVLAVVAFVACDNGTPKDTVGNVNPERTPTMITDDVETLISDSGITRYRIVSPKWLVFDEAKEPHWDFPKGLELESYDDNLKPDASIKCDSAQYLKKKQLWRLDGKVIINNKKNEKFLTRQLFWDQRAHKVYSDSFIHIETPDRVLEGYGFEANERLTGYRIRNVSGIFPVPKRGMGAPPGVLPTTPPAAVAAHQ